MDSSKNRYKDKIKLSKLLPFLVVLVVLMLTVGYSALSDNLAIDSASLVIKTQKVIRITDVRVNSLNDATSNGENHGDTNILSNITLPNSNSTVTYDVVIRNIGNIDMGILNITGLPSNLKYTLSGYTLGDPLCDDLDSTKCKLDSVSTIQITIGYNTNGYDGNNVSYPLNVDFQFYSIDYKAKIGGTYFTTLQGAFDAVPTNDSETVVVLLNNVSERVSIASGKNVVLDFQSYTLSNNGSNPVVVIQGGALRMTNGAIISSAAQGAINVESGGSLTITGGRIVNSNNRQAVYIDNGTVTIGGSAFLSSNAVFDTGKKRGTVQTLANGKLIMTGGTIECLGEKGVAISNAGTSTIGINDGTISTSSPVINGNDYGIYISAGTFNFYDGIARGKKAGFEKKNMVTDVEDGYAIFDDIGFVGTASYNVAYLAQTTTITFDPNGGTVDEPSRVVRKGTAIGTLPTPVLADNIFDGWYTELEGGEQINLNTIVNADDTYYAHWLSASDTYVARIGSTDYHTITEAINSVSGNTTTTIQLLRDTGESITVPAGKDIIFDLAPYTLNSVGGAAVIENNGSCKVISGTITTNSENKSAINNNANGIFVMTGGSIIASGKRQAIYNDGGTVTISGNPYLNAKALVEATNKRGTVQNLANGTLYITGGTIEASGADGIAVTNLGLMTIGVNDANIVTSSPVIQGLSIGVNNSGDAATFNFYDGILKGRSSALNSTPVLRSGTAVANGTETIGGVSYNTAYIEEDS